MNPKRNINSHAWVGRKRSFYLPRIQNTRVSMKVAMSTLKPIFQTNIHYSTLLLHILCSACRTFFIFGLPLPSMVSQSLIHHPLYIFHHISSVPYTLDNQACPMILWYVLYLTLSHVTQNKYGASMYTLMKNGKLSMEYICRPVFTIVLPISDYIDTTIIPNWLQVGFVWINKEECTK